MVRRRQRPRRSPAPAPGIDAQRTFLVTLEVDARQAQQLVFSEEAGDIWLSVVPDDSVDVASESQGVVVDYCLFPDEGVLSGILSGAFPCPEDTGG